MNVQNAKNLVIPEGSVKNIHDKDGRLLWGAVGYDTTYRGDIAQQTYSGKNLLPYPYYETTTTSEGITYTVNSNGTLTINGTWANAGTASSFLLFNTAGILTLPAGTYYFPNQPSQIGVVLYDGSSWRNFTAANGYKLTLAESTPVRRIYLQVNQATPIKSFNNVTFYPMLTTMANPTVADYEPYTGSTPTTLSPAPNPDYPQDIDVVTGTQTVQITAGTESEDFTVNLGSIDVCKIGDYQDYIYKSGDDWYIHKEVGKYTFDGTENWTVGAYGTNPWLLSGVIKTTYDTSKKQVMSEVFRGISNDNRSTSGNNVVYTTSNLQICARNTSITTLAGIQSATNGTDIYYAIATPTDTKITDSTLIGQLDSIHEWLTRYGYNATVSGNLPIIIDRINL